MIAHCTPLKPAFGTDKLLLNTWSKVTNESGSRILFGTGRQISHLGFPFIKRLYNMIFIFILYVQTLSQIRLHWYNGHNCYSYILDLSFSIWSYNAVRFRLNGDPEGRLSLSFFSSTRIRKGDDVFRSASVFWASANAAKNSNLINDACGMIFNYEGNYNDLYINYDENSWHTKKSMLSLRSEVSKKKRAFFTIRDMEKTLLYLRFRESLISKKSVLCLRSLRFQTLYPISFMEMLYEISQLSNVYHIPQFRNVVRNFLFPNM